MAESHESKTSSSLESKVQAPNPVKDDDSDPDFDDLDDVLDQFSANVPSKPQKTSAEKSTSAVSKAEKAPTIDPPIPAGPQPDESDEQFTERLSKEMSTILSSLGNDPSVSIESPEDLAKMGKELEEFTSRMEAEGIQPEDLLKAILGEQALKEAGSSQGTASAAKAVSQSESSDKAGSTTFEDTIRRTMSRLETSNNEATNATAQSATKSEEDMLSEMLKAMESGGADDEGGLSKMFLDMMQQLTHKDMLYDPMKELHTQYPAWLESNESKLPSAEYERYKRQSVIVGNIVKKFEEPGYSDDDPKCREFVWDQMQSMQAEGAPPEELVKNPFPGTDFGGIPGLASDGDGPEEGCTTQ